MEGTIQRLNRGFGFIQENTTRRFWYFNFRDLVKCDGIREGARARFEEKNDIKAFADKLNKGLLKDAEDINHRNPKPQRPALPAASDVEIIPENKSWA